MKINVAETWSQTMGWLRSSVGNVLPKSRRWRVVTWVALTAVVAGSVTAFVVQRASGLADGVALRVGETTVTEEQVRHRIDVLKALYGIEQPTEKDKRDQFRRDSAQAVAVGIVLDNAARSRNIVISEKSARDTLTKMIETQLGGSGHESFIDLLRNYGASEHDVIEEIKRQQRVDRLFQEIGSKPASQVTEEATRNYFEKHRKDMVSPEKRAIQNIVVTSKDQAKQVYQQAKSGRNFAALVGKYSLDESTKRSDGKLGLVEESQLEDAYAEKAFAARAGAVFGPVKTRHGWNVGKVLEVKPGAPLDFAKVEDDLRDKLRWEKAFDAWQKWLSEEIRNADVEYADAYRPADPDATPPVPSVPSKLSDDTSGRPPR